MNPEQFDTLMYSSVSKTILNLQSLNNPPQLFRISTKDRASLFEHFYFSLPEEFRQKYNCSCCRKFFNDYAGIVTVNSDGYLRSALWEISDEIDLGPFRRAVDHLARTVEMGTIKSIFNPKQQTYGHHEKGGFNHFFFKADKAADSTHPSEAEQMFRSLIKRVSQTDIEDVKKTIAILNTHDCPEKRVAIVHLEYLAKCIEGFRDTNNHRPANLIWKMLMDASIGFQRFNSTLACTVLEKVQKMGQTGDTPEYIAAFFNEATSGENYMRPKAAPSESNIDRAEKLIAEMGLEKSLQRRPAKFEELTAVWKPQQDSKQEQEQKPGVFSALRQGGFKPEETVVVSGTVTNVTWNKFFNKILPDAVKIEYSAGINDNWNAFMTAVHADAPPVIRWDRADNRNPVSTYTYVNGPTSTRRWSIEPHQYYAVQGIVRYPQFRDLPVDQEVEDDRFFFVIESAKETNITGQALFPVILIHELYPIRATIEAYSNNTPAFQAEEGGACGVPVSTKGAFPLGQFKVYTKDSVKFYRIDRWE